jgi:hypothetical protein
LPRRADMWFNLAWQLVFVCAHAGPYLHRGAPVNG